MDPVYNGQHKLFTRGKGGEARWRREVTGLHSRSSAHEHDALIPMSTNGGGTSRGFSSTSFIRDLQYFSHDSA